MRVNGHHFLLLDLNTKPAHVLAVFRLPKPVVFRTAFVDYIKVSSVLTTAGPETYIFHSNADGEVLNWIEMPGSLKSTFQHKDALAAFVDAFYAPDVAHERKE